MKFNKRSKNEISFNLNQTAMVRENGINPLHIIIIF